MKIVHKKFRGIVGPKTIEQMEKAYHELTTLLPIVHDVIKRDYEQHLTASSLILAEILEGEAAERKVS